MTRLLVLACVAVIPGVASAQAFTDFRSAHNAGQKFINMGKLAEARPALESALALAKTDEERMQANRTLLIPYRELPDIEPMQASAEYVIGMSKQTAEQSLTRGALLSFILKRGKIDAAVEGYEARLKKTPDDRTLTFILLEAYSTHKKNPDRAADLGMKLLAMDKKAGIKTDVFQQSQIAAQYIAVGKVTAGAALLEEIAPLDEKMTAWNLKEAANAWMKAGEKEKAIAAAKKSLAAKPEARTALLTYFWARQLGDIFLDTGDAKAAIPLYEKAIASTKIGGQIQDTQKKLDAAKAATKP